MDRVGVCTQFSPAGFSVAIDRPEENPWLSEQFALDNWKGKE